MATSTERDPRLDRVTPAGFYAAYPMSDMVGIDAPGALCKPKAFLDLLVDGDCQVDDPLFTFMAHEIFDAVVRDELTVGDLIGNLTRATEDIDAVIAWLEGL